MWCTGHSFIHPFIHKGHGRPVMYQACDNPRSEQNRVEGQWVVAHPGHRPSEHSGVPRTHVLGWNSSARLMAAFISTLRVRTAALRVKMAISAWSPDRPVAQAVGVWQSGRGRRWDFYDHDSVVRGRLQSRACSVSWSLHRAGAPMAVGAGRNTEMCPGSQHK